jgi:nitrogen-specific signal transduction histidine kinase/ActR/RegA family two-component response regulator
MEITKKKLLEGRLRQAQKMQAVGQLAGGVAHDFNNILMAILMGLGMLREKPELSPDTRESLKEIERETARGANLTRQLLLFSRQEAARVEPLEINELITDLLTMLRRLLRENIEVSFHDSAEALWVNADAGMMGQVVMNLCLNARDAMPQGGRLTIATSMAELRAGEEKACRDFQPLRFVCLSISDTGCGMDQTVLRKIFEPFFTTKEVGRGTGLGLATAFGIVQQHHGWIEVDSVVGCGSSFQVFLPEAKRVGAPASSSLDEKVEGGSETILLVEDEVSVRRLVAAWLRKLGYAVLEAGNGAEALKLWEQRRQEIKLLFTDMMMPGNLTGLELALQLKKAQPSLKIISSSGYGANAMNPPLNDSEDIVYLPKPYAPDALAVTVRRCLNKIYERV